MDKNTKQFDIHCYGNFEGKFTKFKKQINDLMPN